MVGPSKSHLGGLPMSHRYQPGGFPQVRVLVRRPLPLDRIPLPFPLGLPLSPFRRGRHAGPCGRGATEYARRLHLAPDQGPAVIPLTVLSRHLAHSFPALTHGSFHPWCLVQGERLVQSPLTDPCLLSRVDKGEKGRSYSAWR